LRRPGDTDRLAIVGATGSGKTHAALWHLSMANYDQKPWIIYDFKGDDLINGIESAYDLDIDDELPKRPGIYICHPNPDDEDELDVHMRKVWARENMGVYVDEGYMVGKNNKGFRRLLTQGRSKHIPLIVLSQRPVWMDRFVFSESGFFRVFRLQHNGDLRKVNEFIPYPITRRLPEYHSYYYDVASNEIGVMPPAPDQDAILDTFDARLSKLKKVV
jgi:hypothetical protein